MMFKNVVGHESLKDRLRQTVREGRISHAWLFFGPEGSGALPMALAFARYILCTDRGDQDACGTCPSCNKMNKYIHPDLHFVSPVNKSKSMSERDSVSTDDFLPEWRDFLLKQPYGSLTGWYDRIDLENKQGLIKEEESRKLAAKMSLKPFESDFKVIIIWHPDKMNDQAANKLLKLLEEPPPMTVFILAGDNPDQLLSTVRSRCTPVKVPRITDNDLRTVLLDRHGLTEDKADDLVQLASGNYLRLLELISEEEDLNLNFVRFRDLMRLCYTKDISGLIRISEELSQLTREKQKTFLDYSLGAIRESLALHFNTPGIVYLAENEKTFIPNFAPFVTGKNVAAMADELTQAMADIERNVNGRIIFLDMALKLSELIVKK